MIDFVYVGTPPFLRIAFWVAMEIMHFSHSPNKFFYDKMFRNMGGPNERYGTHVKLSCGVQGSLNLDPGANQLSDIELLWIKALVGLNLSFSSLQCPLKLGLGPKHLISLLSCPNIIYIHADFS